MSATSYKIVSQIVPLPKDDIDTDAIIPSKYLTTTTTEGLGKHVFAEYREKDPAFPFNVEKYRSASILVTGENFGCGSSREHAAWALADWGIQVVIAPSFADIFYNNALKNKMLPIYLERPIVQAILSDEGTYEIDLVSQQVIFPNGRRVDFEIAPYPKECLLTGMDDMDYLLSRLPQINEYFSEKTFYFDIGGIQE